MTELLYELYMKYGISHSGLNTECPYNWTGDMVADMLENRAYLGHTVNMRYSTKSYKDKKKIERPESDWLIFENTHEALVDQETWDIVQEVHIRFRDFDLNDTDGSFYDEKAEQADSANALSA